MTASTYPVAQLTRTDRLYSPGQIALATFLGSPLAGSLFLADNFRLLGERAKMEHCIWAGFAITLVLAILGWFFLGPFSALVVAVACTWAAKSVANRLHGMIVVQHEMHGGEIGSWSMVVWLSLAILVIICGVQFAIEMALLVAKANA